MRETLSEARKELEETGQRTIVFVDELHRFNRAQQDVLLPDVEEGRVVLIGATTQNPFFAVNSPLLSRSRIFNFEPLSHDNVKTVMRRALADSERGLGSVAVQASEDALDFLAEACDGDARRALNALEVGVLSAETLPVIFTRDVAQESIQRKRSITTAQAMPITMWSARSSKVCAAAIRTRRFIGLGGCSNRVRIRVSSPVVC